MLLPVPPASRPLTTGAPARPRAPAQLLPALLATLLTTLLTAQLAAGQATTAEPAAGNGTTPAAPGGRPVTVLVTGANRGIGLAIATQYADRGYRVIATARDPAKATELKALAARQAGVSVEKLDVTSARQVAALARRYQGQPIDILVNNAGILGDNTKQKFGTLDYSSLDAVMATNVAGPVRMAEAFIDNLAMSDQKKLMNISSYVGSIEKTFGGQLFYRSSKAALNMAMRTLSMEFKRAREPGRKEITVGLIDPGVVDTEFGPKPPIPLISAEKSAAGVLTVIDAYDLKRTGKFYTYTGGELPW